MSAVTKEKSNYVYKLFRVRRANGKITTVSVCPVLATMAIKAMGSVNQVSEFVRQAALKYEPDSHKEQFRSCSGFVSVSLRDHVSSLSRTAQRSASAAV